MKLGIIAEDDSDIGVVKELTSRMLHPGKIGFKRFVGGGCGKIRRKCRAWTEVLVRQGCLWVVLVHDLDQNDEDSLREQLEDAIAGVRTRASIVLIPIREIEAWLLFDPDAIASVFGRRRPPRLPGKPESLDDPKKTLSDIVWRAYGKKYLNTVHNRRIAKKIDIQSLSRARSFTPYGPFVEKVRKALD